MLIRGVIVAALIYAVIGFAVLAVVTPNGGVCAALACVGAVAIYAATGGDDVDAD